MTDTIKLEDGKTYVNGRGDVVGPMWKEAGVFFDQFGVLYHENGRQLNHTHDSTGNIVEEKL